MADDKSCLYCYLLTKWDSCADRSHKVPVCVFSSLVGMASRISELTLRMTWLTSYSVATEWMDGTLEVRGQIIIFKIFLACAETWIPGNR